MGKAICEALVAKTYHISVSNPVNPRVAGAKWNPNNKKAARNVDIIFVCVRPHVVPEVLQEIAPVLQPRQLVISIAAGVSLAKLKKYSGDHKKLVRVMPNLAVQVSDSMSAWKSIGLNKREKALIAKLLGSFGKALEVKNEQMINAATAISGAGPAYVAAFLESMARAAQKYGFSKSASRLLALQTIDGTEDYIEKTGIEFSALKKAVQTKGGTTEAAFKVLKRGKWQKVFEKALNAAYKKACKLGCHRERTK